MPNHPMLLIIFSARKLKKKYKENIRDINKRHITFKLTLDRERSDRVLRVRGGK